MTAATRSMDALMLSASHPMELSVRAEDAEAPASEAAPSGGSAAPDDNAFAHIFAEHAAVVARVLRRMGVPDADLDDVTQEVFVVVYRRWSDFRGESTLRTWIYGIALRKAISHRRRKHVRDEVGLRDDHLGSSPPPQQHALERSERRQQLAQLVDGLSDKKREVFVLYELEEVDMKDIAAMVDAPLHTCYSRLQAARTELKRQLSRQALRQAREEDS